jgi:hypothetical protein
MRKRDMSPAESLKIENFYTALMPTQRLLKKLDPDGTRTVEEVEAELSPRRAQYEELVINNRPDLVLPPEPGVKEAMTIKRTSTASGGLLTGRCKCSARALAAS